MRAFIRQFLFFYICMWVDGFMKCIYNGSEHGVMGMGMGMPQDRTGLDGGFESFSGTSAQMSRFI